MTVCKGELPFSIDDKGGEKAVGRGVMIAWGVLVFPSMPKGENVEQWLVNSSNTRGYPDLAWEFLLDNLLYFESRIY